MTREPAVLPKPQVPFLTAVWRHLVIANFEVEIPFLGSMLPAGTELDLFEGRALVSLVGFRFLDTRVLGVPIPGHRDFDEVNLRFYVRRRGPDGAWRRAVTFVREFVPRRAIAAVARLCYNEPYYAVPMRHELITDTGSDGRLASAKYAWQVGDRWHSIGAMVTGVPAEPAEGSEARFTIEHYWGYSRQRDGTTREYQVQHEPWRIWPANSVTLDLDAGVTYGADWAGVLGATPTEVLVAEGSTVAVFPGQRLSKERHPVDAAA